MTELLEQASLDSPIFKARWKWDAGRSLQLLRFQKGKRIPPQIQRTRSDDLLASVFPQVAACQENIQGDREIPNHPLIREVMKDVLGEAMDLEGLKQLLVGMQTGVVRCLAVDTTTPSQFAHELLNANPYAFLDDAPLEERRARAVAMRGTVPDSVLGEAGRLDPAAIAAVREEIWPDVRDEHEFHDLLCSLGVIPEGMLTDSRTRHWGLFLERLAQHGRATVGESDRIEYAVAAERIEVVRLLWPEMKFARELAAPVEKKELVREEVLRKIVLGWLGILGPVTARSLGERIGLAASEMWKAMLMLEANGTILRGVFEANGTGTVTDEDVEWCERRLLQRIHKRTLGALRKQIEPVAPAVYMRWLLQWQHVAPQAQLAGEHGVLEAIRGLEGFEAPAVEWERSLLPQRVAGYDPRWLDALCMAGVVGWGRVSPHPAFDSVETGGSKSSARRVVPTSMAPVTFFVREEALWMDLCLQQRQISPAVLDVCLSELAGRLRSFLGERGAMFSGDLARGFAVPVAELQRALWELVAAGLVTADGFDSLRILIDPKRNGGLRPRGKVSHAAGRWSLLSGGCPCGNSCATRGAAGICVRCFVATLWRGLSRSAGAGGDDAALARVAGDLSADGSTWRGSRWAVFVGLWRRAVCVAGGGRVAAGDATAAGVQRRSHCCGSRSDESGWHCGSGRAGGCCAGKDRRIRKWSSSRWSAHASADR